MEVKISRRVADTYKRAAKRAFPREDYAVLLGTFDDINDIYHIKNFYFPLNREKYCTELQVDPPVAWWDEAMTRADRLNLIPLGDIHSHCYDADLKDQMLASGTFGFDSVCTPSHADLRGSLALAYMVRGFVPIFGICGVRKKHDKFTSKFQFWPAQPAIKVSIF